MIKKFINREWERDLKVKIFTALVASLATLAGCGSLEYDKATPMQIGDSTYLISMESSGYAVTNKKVELYQQANANCAAKGKKMERISDNQNKGGKFLDYTVELQYKCV